MSILRYERPAAGSTADSVLTQALGGFVSILAGLPVLWLLCMVGVIGFEEEPLRVGLAWVLVLLPAGALLLMVGLVTVPVAGQLGGRTRVGWALALLLLSLLAVVGFGVWLGLAWQLTHGIEVGAYGI